MSRSLQVSLTQIVFERRKEDDVGNDCRIQVDALDCETTEQGESFQAFYSFKSNGSALRYELGTNIRTGDCVWRNGPFPPGDWNDWAIFLHALKNLLDEDERAETDDGYIGGDPDVTKCPGGVRFNEDEGWTRTRSVARSRGETLNHRLKSFKVLGGKFRHDIEKHGMCFRACLVLVQLSFDVGSRKLFEVDNYNQSS